jgi:hypothetical protein
MLRFSLLLLIFWSVAGWSYASPQVEFMGNYINKNNPGLVNAENNIKAYIADNVQDYNRKDSIRVQILRNNNLSWYALIHVLSKRFFKFHTIRINLTQDGSKIIAINKNYEILANDILNQNKILSVKAGLCPQEYLNNKDLFVLVSPSANDTATNIAKSLDKISEDLKKDKNYTLVKLYNKKVTVQDYKNILACPNLSKMITISSEDDMGKTFFLDDGLFDAEYFNQVNFNQDNSVFVLNVCNSFRNVNNGFCSNITSMPKHPTIYTAGSTELLIYGSPETYACMWHQYLIKQAVPSIETLQECARQNDPSFEGYSNGVYFVGDVVDSKAKVIVRTNYGRIIVIPTGDYKIVTLAKGESIINYSMNIQGKTIFCSANKDNKVELIKNRGLRTGEFYLDYDSRTEIPSYCEYAEVSRMERRPGHETRDIYGLYPEQKCYENNRL